jgi:predicted dehydrogenase
MKWGLIGAGDIVRKRVASALREARGSELLAVSRQRAALVQEFADSIGAARAYAAWRQLVVDPDVEAVYVATPVNLHAEQTIAAAEAGKHVLCEKPMALNVADCDRMIAASRANGVTLGIAYYRHFYPVVRRIRSLLDEGAIGTPVLAQVDAFERFNPEPHEERHWFVRKAEAGGGPMFDFGCHRIEVLLSLFGDVASVTGLTANVVFSREVEDTAIATLQFVRGTCATITVTHAANEPQDSLRIFGTTGSIHVEKLNAGDLLLKQDGAERREALPPASNIHLPSIQDFVDAVAAGREPGVDGAIGRAVAAIESQIYAPPSH